MKLAHCALRLPARSKEPSQRNSARFEATPKIVIRTWKQTDDDGERVAESEVTAALRNLDPLWDELFPAEQARVVRLLAARA